MKLSPECDILGAPTAQLWGEPPPEWDILPGEMPMIPITEMVADRLSAVLDPCLSVKLRSDMNWKLRIRPSMIHFRNRVHICVYQEVWDQEVWESSA